MLTIDAQSGLLTDGAYCPSTNCDDRPKDDVPELLVVHCISLPPGEFGGQHIQDFFQNRLNVAQHEYFGEIQHLQVSAHALIKRDGDVVQFVPFHKRAWHAGESHYAGRDRCNDFSIGIELEGTDDTDYRAVQYWKLAQLIAALRHAYPSMIECPIVGHSDIAPTRKTDPGIGFDWSQLARHLETLGTSQTF